MPTKQTVINDIKKLRKDLCAVCHCCGECPFYHNYSCDLSAILEWYNV